MQRSAKEQRWPKERALTRASRQSWRERATLTPPCRTQYPKVGDRRVRDAHQVVGRDREDRVRRAGRGPHRVVAQQVGVAPDGSGRACAMGGMPPMAKPVATRTASASARSTRPWASVAELARVEAVGARDEHQHELVVHREHQRLHDLPELGADRRGRLLRRARAVLDDDDARPQAEVVQRALDAACGGRQPVRLVSHRGRRRAVHGRQLQLVLHVVRRGARRGA